LFFNLNLVKEETSAPLAPSIVAPLHKYTDIFQNLDLGSE